MIWFLRALFILILASMLWVTSWASLHQPLSAFVRSATFREPWVIATLLDAYWAFVTFFVWVAWKERAFVPRVLWFISIVLLGNIATATYMLRELFAVPPNAPLVEVLVSRNERRVIFPAALAALSVGLYLLA